MSEHKITQVREIKHQPGDQRDFKKAYPMHQLGQLLAQQIHSIFRRGLSSLIPNGE